MVRSGPTGVPESGRRYSGWTLVEVLTSMSIVFILTGTIGHVGGRQIERAKLLAARQQMQVIEIALETYAMDCRVYPTTAQGLDALWKAPVLHPVPSRWNGPYIDGPVGDFSYQSPGPDGRPYVLRPEGEGYLR